MVAQVQSTESILSLRRPTNAGVAQAITGLKARLAKLKDHTEATPEISVVMAFTDRGCGHACRHCGGSSGRYIKGRHLPIETLEAVKKSGLLNDKVELTGGEPLDHPDIKELVKTFNGTIWATNGFSMSTHPPERRASILDVAGSVIGHTSFHILDRWKGNSPGRDAVIKHTILAGRTPYIFPLGESGAERQTALALLAAVARLMDDSQLQNAVKNNEKYVRAALSDTIVNVLCVLPYSHIRKVGRGKKLNGGTYELALESQPYDYMDDATGNIALLPDGSLTPRLLICEGWERPEHAVFGHITEDTSILRQKFIECTAAYLAKKINRPDAVWQALLEQMFVNIESELRSYEANMQLSHDPVIVTLRNALLRRYEELFGTVVSPIRSFLPTPEFINDMWQRKEREIYEFLFPKDSG